MTNHYCDIFTDCWHCPAPFCPYEKNDENFRIEDDEDDEEEDK